MGLQKKNHIPSFFSSLSQNELIWFRDVAKNRTNNWIFIILLLLNGWLSLTTLDDEFYRFFYESFFCVCVRFSIHLEVYSSIHINSLLCACVCCLCMWFCIWHEHWSWWVKILLFIRQTISAQYVKNYDCVWFPKSHRKTASSQN